MRVALLALLPLSIAGAQAEWAVSTKPILDVAGVNANGDVVFQNLGGATRLSNGSLLVVDRGSTSIRLIDANGKLIKNVGREGTGPGEYRIIISGTGCGADSLLVWARETSVMVGPSGAAARQFVIPAETGSKMRPLMSFSCGRDGNIVYLTQPLGRVPLADGMMQMTGAVAVVDRSGKNVTTIDSIPAGVWMPVPRGAFPRPLGPTTTAVAVGDAVVVGVSDSARVWVIDKKGKAATIQIPWTPRAPTDEELKLAITAITDMAPVQSRAMIAPELAKAPKPSTLPPYFGLFGDPDGNLWVQQSVPGAKRTDLIAMGLDGKVRARTIIPMAVSIMEIGRDYILASYDDANDETHLAVFSLRKR